MQNGLLPTREFYTLFDRGDVAIEPETSIVSVSSRVREAFQNGRRHYQFDSRELAVVPLAGGRPTDAALEWHLERRFLG